MCVILRLYKECKYHNKTGSWFKPTKSRIKNEDGTYRFDWLIPLWANILTNGGYLCVISVGWKLAKASGMNQGVISTLLSLASLINIIVFYFKFG